MKPVRWGVLGVSKHFITRVLLPMRASELVDLHAIASRSLGRAVDAGARYGIPACYGSYEELLADSSVEAVFIPLPNHLHLEWIRKAADAGKHILCEKPLTLNAGDTHAAIEYAVSKDVLLMEAFMYRFHPQWLRAKELVNTGAVGRLTAVHTFFAYNNTDPKNIRNIHDMGGGGLYDIGCYAVSTSRFLFGGEPDRVLALIDRDPVFGTDILTSAILDFGSGRALFTVGTNTFQSQKVDIYCTGGNIHVHLPFNTYADFPAKMTVVTGLGSREIEFPAVDQYGIEVEAFSRAVRDGVSSPVPMSDALGNAAAVDALFRSAVSGTWETVRIPALKK